MGTSGTSEFRATLSRQGRHVPALDGLRGVAIGLVVVHHATAFLMPGTFGRVLPGGFLGVDLFFVLSGFLITTLILERRAAGERGLRAFYIRRALRILPAVSLMLVGVGLYTVITGAGDVGSVIFSMVITWTNFASWILAFFPSWFSSFHWVSPMGIVWSLAVEEQFYVVWPAVLLVLLRLGKSRRFILGFAIVGVLAFTARSAMLWQHHHDWVSVYFRTDARAGELLTGAALAVASSFGLLARGSGRRLSIAASILFVAFLVGTQTVDASSAWLYLGGFTAIAVGVAVVVAAAADGRPAICRVLAWRPLVGLGRVSYGLYLWHYPVFYVVAQEVRPDAVERLLIAFGFTALLVAFSYRFIEKPAMALKGRLLPRPAGAKPPTAPSVVIPTGPSLDGVFAYLDVPTVEAVTAAVGGDVARLPAAELGRV